MLMVVAGTEIAERAHSTFFFAPPPGAATVEKKKKLLSLLCGVLQYDTIKTREQVWRVSGERGAADADRRGGRVWIISIKMLRLLRLVSRGQCLAAPEPLGNVFMLFHPCITPPTPTSNTNKH